MRAESIAAAFGDRPDAVLPAGTDPWDRWLAGVVAGGQGRYAAAAALLTPLRTGGDPVLAALAGSTLASHLRQLGAHAAARTLDAEAARRLPADGDRADRHGMDHAGAAADVLLGLAADAIGLGRPAETERLLSRPGAGGDSAWRTVVRTGWLTAELALATDRPAVAVAAAERARAVATQARAVRHTVKSTLVLGAALTAGGTPDGRRRAECLLTEALTSSLNRGMLPLAWPCALLLAELAPERAADLTKIAGDALTGIFARSDARQRRLAAASPWFPAALARSGDPTRTGVGLAT